MTAAANPPLSLDDVLAYRHNGILGRYRKEHNASPEEAEEVFRETLKWLYVCSQATTAGVACAITYEIEKLDWMWHNFILFTRDYADFCDRSFGFFLHHTPSEDEDSPLTEAETRETLERQYGLVYDVLGEETLSAWYDECRYTAA